MTTHDDDNEAVISEVCRTTRVDILDMVERAGSGHVDSSFSVVEILAVLYHRVMRHRPSNPTWTGRDRLVLSKGHAAPALYSILARLGYFELELLNTLRQPGSLLQGHPKPPLPGIDAASGSLGQGLSVASGMALRQRDISPGAETYAVLSDGELDEGQTWEAFLFGAHYGLSNLTVIVDANGLQYSGPCEDVMLTQPLLSSLSAIGWKVSSINGHDITALTRTLEDPGAAPALVVCRTVKGRGVNFFENQLGRHGKVPSEAEMREARRQLRGPSHA